MLLRAFGRLLALVCVTWVGAQEAPVPTHLKVKATFTRTDKDGKPEVYAQPSVVTVDGKTAKITVGNADEGLEFIVTPKVANGAITLALKSEHWSGGVAPDALPASDDAKAPVAAPASPKAGLPRFHGVLPADKLFSIEDATGARKWLPLGRKVDGWTLRTYDPKREALTITRLGESRELGLHQPVITDAQRSNARVLSTDTSVTVLPGKPAVAGRVKDYQITVEAEILDLSK
jgi:hypothetical protein